MGPLESIRERKGRLSSNEHLPGRVGSAARSRAPVEGEPRRTRTEIGSTLVELAIAVVVVVVVLGSMLKICVEHSKERMLNRETRLAFAACSDSLEEVRAIPFADVEALDGVGFDVPSDNGTAGALYPVPGDPDGLPGKFIVIVDKQAAGGLVQYRVITEVTWVGSRGTRRLAFETLVGRRK